MAFVSADKWRDTTLRVFLADDSSVRRRQLLVVLEAEADLLVVAESADIAAVPAIAEFAPADVVVTATMAPPVSAARVPAGVRVHSPAAVGVVLGIPDDPAEAVAAVRNGAIAFLPTEAVLTQTAAAVRSAALGLPILPDAVVAAVLDEVDRLGATGAAGGVRPPRLTDVEREVLIGVAAGATWAALGDRLGVPAESAARIAHNALARLVRHQETVSAAMEAGLLAR